MKRQNNLLGSAILTMLAFLAADSFAVSVNWTKVGVPHSAESIAVCTNGSLFALNYDRTLWINQSAGADSGWQQIGTAVDARGISCVGQTLLAFNADRSLWRNTGSQLAPAWTKVGQPSSAAMVTGFSFDGKQTYFALNDNRTLWVSSSGTDGTWHQIGEPFAARQISSAYFAVFALNTDQSLWRSYHTGLDGTWVRIDTPSQAKMIAAQSNVILYALNYDQSLWRGTVVP